MSKQDATGQLPPGKALDFYKQIGVDRPTTLPRGPETNERLGLPFGKMRWVVVAFDVDGTLIDAGPHFYEPIIQLLKILAKFKNIKIVMWSGGGKEYAARWGRLLGLDEFVWKYASKTEHEQIKPDIAIDDIQDTAIGTINLIVRNK